MAMPEPSATRSPIVARSIGTQAALEFAPDPRFGMVVLQTENVVGLLLHDLLRDLLLASRRIDRDNGPFQVQ